jgi:hypothetical protein
MHFSATYSSYGGKPAVLEAGNAAICEHLDLPTIVRKQKIRRIIPLPFALRKNVVCPFFHVAKPS